MQDNYYNEIKDQLINNEVYKKVKDYSKNRKDLETYYNVGKLLIEAQGGEKRAKYGNNLIKEYSRKLTKELDKKFSLTLLKNIRQYYLVFQKCPTMSDKLTWGHYIEIIWIKDINEIRKLRNKIKNNEYARLDNKTKEKLINNEENKFIMEYSSDERIFEVKYYLDNN
ncbi:MAG: hypothetical protein J6J17_04850 [Bacilli bacterium]|nr:hypothetical protein [Bacilli bacterium]